MGDEPEAFTLGVEEEYHIVDTRTRELRPRAESLLSIARRTVGEQVQPELLGSQIEAETRVCRSLADVRAELTRLRSELAVAAEASDSAVCAMGTHPFSEWLGQSVTPKERYLELAEDYRLLAWEQLICGCHVHVAVPDPELAIQVMDRARPWVAPLLALGANSPFWEGVDTGYASYRSQLWARWPLSGTPDVFGSRAAYDELVEALVATDTISDATKLYWDLRPSARYPTVEVRVSDVCQTVDEAVMLAGLARALVRTCHAEAVRDEPPAHARAEVLRAARWRAARYGLDGELIDVEACRSAPAGDVVARLLEVLRPDLEDHGEWDEVSSLVAATFERGNGARRQRETFDRSGSLVEVVDAVVAGTRSAGPAAPAV